jgi:hypothetical protein
MAQVASHIFKLLFSKKKVAYSFYTTLWLGYILGDSLKKSSGGPDK